MRLSQKTLICKDFFRFLENFLQTQLCLFPADKIAEKQAESPLLY